VVAVLLVHLNNYGRASHFMHRFWEGIMTYLYQPPLEEKAIKHHPMKMEKFRCKDYEFSVLA
jgi:hypothetical protein